jgi:hypothetical protein
VIKENGWPVFVSMSMSEAACETMKRELGEGEVVQSEVGLAYKRTMTSSKNPNDPDGLWPLEIPMGAKCT